MTRAPPKYIPEFPLIHMYIYFHHRTLSALPHDCLPTLEPGTRSRISTRFMARGDETPRAHQGGAPRARGWSPRPSRDVCVEPLRLQVLWKPQAFPLRGLGLSRKERVRAVASVARLGPWKSTVIYFSVREDQSLYTYPN